MEARLNVIEDNLAIILSTIAGQLDPDTGYQYHSTTGTVNVYDEVVSVNTNLDDKMVNYEIEQNSDERKVYIQDGQNRIANEVDYKFIARLHNEGDETSPKRAIIRQMNEVLSDLKRVFSADLNNTVLKEASSIDYNYSNRVFAEDGDKIHTGDLEAVFTIRYTQSIYNPDINAC